MFLALYFDNICKITIRFMDIGELNSIVAVHSRQLWTAIRHECTAKIRER